MQSDITISETIGGFMRPRARVLTVLDGEGFDTPEEIMVRMRGPNGRHLGDFWTSKVNLVNFAKEIITAYEEKPRNLTSDEIYPLN